MPLAETFKELLDSGAGEEALHVFLKQHPAALMRWCGVSGSPSRLISKASLHSHVTDFAVGEWRHTTSRWQWTLVELERPEFRMFTKAGDPAHELSHALRQIADWRAWIQANMHFARTLLPDVVPLCPAGIIIGRRALVDASDQDRLEMLQIMSQGVRISTYDALLDICTELDRGNS